MHPCRAILSVLVAVAVLFAPMTAAWASDAQGMAMAMAHATAHAVGGEGSVSAAPMQDCASMTMGAVDMADCPCCDTDTGCTTQLCMAKCFQLVGLVQQSKSVARLTMALLRPIDPAHRSDWSDQPRPPPPRT